MPDSLAERVHRAKHDITIADDLIRDYLPFIKSETSKALNGRTITEGDDELSISMLAFFEAISSYSRIKGPFLKYTSLIIKRKMIDNYRKEKKHDSNISLDIQTSDDNDTTLKDSLADNNDAYEEYDTGAAIKKELHELLSQLEDFSVSLNDIVDDCPKREKTLAACQKVVTHAYKNPALFDELKSRKKIPITAFALGTGVEKKTLERHRNYIIALLLIASNGYDLIRDHMNEIFSMSARGA